MSEHLLQAAFPGGAFRVCRRMWGGGYARAKHGAFLAIRGCRYDKRKHENKHPPAVSRFSAMLDSLAFRRVGLSAFGDPWLFCDARGLVLEANLFW